MTIVLCTIGAATLTSWFFRLLDAIDRPCKRQQPHHRRMRSEIYATLFNLRTKLNCRKITTYFLQFLLSGGTMAKCHKHTGYYAGV